MLRILSLIVALCAFAVVIALEEEKATKSSVDPKSEGGSALPPSGEDPVEDNRRVLGEWTDLMGEIRFELALVVSGAGEFTLERKVDGASPTRQQLVEVSDSRGRKFVEEVESQGNGLTEGERAALARSLDTLMKFRGDSEFHRIGFAVSGQYSGWQKEVERNMHADHLSLDARIAYGDLWTIGMEFMKAKGEATDVSRQLLPHLELQLSEESEAAAMVNSDWYVINASGELEIWDSMGLITTCKKLNR